MSKYIALALPASAPLSAEALVVGDMTEGSHTITNELVESVKGGKTDYEYGANAEEYGFTANRIPDDEGQEALIQAIRNKEQIRIWLADRRIVKDDADADAHKTVFGYAVVGEAGHSFDLEEDTIEFTGNFKFESAEGYLPKLPDSVLDPSTVTVEFETPGEYTGTLENRTGSTGV